MLQRFEETEISFLNEILKRKPAVAIIQGDVGDKTQICVNQIIPCTPVAIFPSFEKNQFLLIREDRNSTDIPIIEINVPKHAFTAGTELLSAIDLMVICHEGQVLYRNSLPRSRV